MHQFIRFPDIRWDYNLKGLARRMRGNCVKIMSVLLLVFGGFWSSLYTYGTITDRVNQSYQFLFNIENLSESLYRAETHQRGYLLSQSPDGIASFQEVLNHIPKLFRDSYILAQNQPSQIARLDVLKALWEDRANEMQHVIDLTKKGKQEESLKYLKANQEKNGNRGILFIIHDIKNEEMALMRERLSYISLMRKMTPWFFVIFCSVITSLILLPWNDERPYAEIISDLTLQYRAEFYALRERLDRIYPGLDSPHLSENPTRSDILGPEFPEKN